MISIRNASSKDREEIRQVYLHSFSEAEVEPVATLAINLLSEATNPKTFSLVAEMDGSVVGHIAFSPVSFTSNENLTGYILAPLAVQHNLQNQGIGSRLIKHGLATLSREEVDIVFVYGDPAYYNRFGFDARMADGFTPPYTLQHPFGWQALVINEGNSRPLPSNISCVPSLHNPELW